MEARVRKLVVGALVFATVFLVLVQIVLLEQVFWDRTTFSLGLFAGLYAGNVTHRIMQNIYEEDQDHDQHS